MRKKTRGQMSLRTLGLLVTGCLAAVVVTSLSAMNLGSNESAVETSMIGGSAVLLLAAATVLAFAVRMRHKRDRALWLGVALALTLTSIGATAKAARTLGASPQLLNSGADAVYGAGLIVLLAVLSAVPWLNRTDEELPWIALESVSASSLLLLGAWVYWREPFSHALRTMGSPIVLGVFSGLWAVTCGASWTLLFSLRARSHTQTLPWALLGLGALAIVAGDGAWLVAILDGTWAPGGFADFVHLVGHVALAAAASSALDVDSASG